MKVSRTASRAGLGPPHALALVLALGCSAPGPVRVRHVTASAPPPPEPSAEPPPLPEPRRAARGAPPASSGCAPVPSDHEGLPGEEHALPPPGSPLSDVSALTRADERWQVSGSTGLELVNQSLELVYLEYPGLGAGLTLLRHSDSELCVVGSWVEVFGGNGLELGVVDQWTSPEGNFMVLLIGLQGLQRAGPGGKSTYDFWVALGSDGLALWQLTLFDLSEDHYSGVSLQPDADSVKLVAERNKGGQQVFVLDAARDAFVPQPLHGRARRR